MRGRKRERQQTRVKSPVWLHFILYVDRHNNGDDDDDAVDADNNNVVIQNEQQFVYITLCQSLMDM